MPRPVAPILAQEELPNYVMAEAGLFSNLEKLRTKTGKDNQETGCESENRCSSRWREDKAVLER